MENPQENLSPEELAAKKNEMLDFYKESMPYLEAQLAYEKMLSEIDETRLKRTQIQMTYAQMMAPPEEGEMPENITPPAPQPTAKKRKLKKQEA